MMKKIIFVLLLCFSLVAGAQTVDDRTLGYSVRYEKAHLFLQKDSGLNVVDYDIEWPEIVGFSDVVPLKQAISQSLADVSVTTFDSLSTAVSTEYGTPVTKQFKTIPDDRRFCYITATARIVGYSPNRWIAYYLDDAVKPQALSTFKARNESQVIVYDIASQRLYTAKELLSSAVVNRLEPQDFYDNLFAPLSDDFFNDMQECNVNGVWTDGTTLYFLVHVATSSRSITYTASMPLEDYSYVLSRNARKVFFKEPKRKTVQPITVSNTWHGDPIYNKVEKMPEIKGGSARLQEYFSHVSHPDVVLTKAERVYVSFVVDKTGSIQDVCVVNPVSPSIDRHAVSVIKGMPPYTPGEQNGSKVCVRLYMPVSYMP